MSGREDYENDLKAKPIYHDGSPRKAWDELPDYARWSWNRYANRADTGTDYSKPAVGCGCNAEGAQTSEGSKRIAETAGWPELTCRKCDAVNPMVYLAPVIIPGASVGTCICFDCASRRGWLDADGNLRDGITL